MAKQYTVPGAGHYTDAESSKQYQIPKVGHFTEQGAGTQTDGIPNSSVAITTFAPVGARVGAVGESVANANLVFTTFAPGDQQTVAGVQSEPIPQANVVLTTFAPSDQRIGAVGEPVAQANVVILTFAPGTFTTGAIAEPVIKKTGGSKRRVIIGNQHFVIDNDDQLRRLLQAHLDSLQTQLEEITVEDQEDRKTVVRLKRTIGITQSRINKLYDNDEDEEILLLFAS